MQLLEQNVSEARADLTKTLRRMAEGEPIAVVVRKRGNEPQAVMIPPEEATRYFKWRASQARSQSQQREHGDLETRVSEPHESPSDAHERAQKRSQASRSLNLPAAWPTPEEFARHYLSDGISPEKVLKGLARRYGPRGLTRHEANDIVMSAVDELGRV